MLSMLRRKKNNPLIMVVLGLVVLLMVVFGISVDNIGSGAYSAKVNGEEISAQDFNSQYASAYRNQQSRNRNYGRDQAQADELRENVLYGMVTAKILAQHAKKVGLEVDDQALKQAVVDNPNFHVNGRFEKKQYERVLNSLQMSPHRFEEAERDRVLAQAYLAMVQSLGVSEPEIEDAIAWDAEKVDLEFVSIPNAEFVDQVATVSDADIEAWKKDGDAEAAVTAYYQKNRSRKYDVPEKACASHILVRVQEKLPPDQLAEKRQKIGAALEAVKAGKMTFEEAAKAYSEDGNKDRGGDLGCFAEGETQPRLAEIAFSMKPGDVSEIVKTPFGLHVVKLREKKEPIRKTIDSVRPEIEKELAKTAAAGRLAKAQADALYAKVKETKDVAAAAAALNEANPDGYSLKADTTGAFGRGRDFVPKLGKAPEVASIAWTLTEEAPMPEGPVATETGWAVIRLKERTKADKAMMEAQRMPVTYRLILDKQNAVVDKWSENLRGQHEVLIDPIAIRYDDEAENLRAQRRQR